MAQLQCLIYAEDVTVGEQIRDQVAATAHVAVCGEATDEASLRNHIEGGKIDLLLVGLGKDCEAVFHVVEAMEGDLPELAFAGPLSESGWIVRAMRLGAREYLSLPMDGVALSELIARLSLEPHAKEPSAQTVTDGKLVAVMGAKGGVGTTTVACGIAAGAAGAGRSSAVVDLDLQFGDAALHFDLTPRYSLADLAKRGTDVDAAFLRNLLAEHPCGVSLLAAPRQPEESERVHPIDVETGLRLIRSTRDVSVADLPRVFDERCLRALFAADLVILVGALDLPAMAATKRSLELLARLDIPRDKLRLVINRYAKDRALERDAEEFFGTRADFVLPNDYVTALEAVSAGRPLMEVAPHRELTHAIEALSRQAQRWCGLEIAEPPKSGRKLGWPTWMRR
jgi:pilus assembly protein CpaE